MSYDVIIVGAGPGGLACAQVTAAHGLSTLVIERNTLVGKKVCAGGITWNGLLKHLDADISEKHFCTQHIFTRHQKAQLVSENPMIATVNRQVLGKHLADQAEQAGAQLYMGCRVVGIEQNCLTYLNGKGITKSLHFKTLVGADGSSSLVRRCLKLSTRSKGVGINYQLPESFDHMQWHLDSKLFSSGYGWVFPHKETVSIGAYADSRAMNPKLLQKNLKTWAKAEGFNLSQAQGRAEYINFDFRGYRFGNRYLVGDAAGLASGLTGEGIYPAIISGKEIAEEISGGKTTSTAMKKLIKNNKLHRDLVTAAGKSMLLSTLFSEVFTYLLKKGLMDFSAAEMAR